MRVVQEEWEGKLSSHQECLEGMRVGADMIEAEQRTGQHDCSYTASM